MNITKILIPVEKAISLVVENVQRTSKTEKVSIEKARGYVLAQDINSPLNLPPFRQSAMDGYALNIGNSNSYSLIGEVKAGDISNISLSEGQAIRIFTGAPVPDTANTVVKQELVVRENHKIIIEGIIKPGSNIRPLGEQIQKNALALSKGITIEAGTIGFLAGLGIHEVLVFSKPKVAIIITGNELVEVGQPLQEGQVYESNAIMLKNALASLSIKDVDIHRVKDDYKETEKVLKQSLNEYDFTLVSGGISVGDYDFVGSALDAIGVKEVFYKVRQKPGKPLYFGRKDNHFVFALPGNPASALSCFYVYVALSIARYLGKQESAVLNLQLISENNFAKNDTRAQFLKALAKAETVEILEGQESSMLKSFAIANALVYMPEGIKRINQGEMLNVLLLPN